MISVMLNVVTPGSVCKYETKLPQTLPAKVLLRPQKKVLWYWSLELRVDHQGPLDGVGQDGRVLRRHVVRRQALVVPLVSKVYNPF
jgi:hypothetical protein